MLLRPKNPAQDTEVEPQWKQVLGRDGVKIENLLRLHGEDGDWTLPELRPVFTHDIQISSESFTS
jgi:hypothetical protein